MKRILKPVTYALAALYFLADAAFIAIAKPISDWLARHVVLRRLRAWIESFASAQITKSPGSSSISMSTSGWFPSEAKRSIAASSRLLNW